MWSRVEFIARDETGQAVVGSEEKTVQITSEQQKEKPDEKEYATPVLRKMLTQWRLESKQMDWKTWSFSYLFCFVYKPGMVTNSSCNMQVLWLRKSFKESHFLYPRAQVNEIAKQTFWGNWNYRLNCCKRWNYCIDLILSKLIMLLRFVFWRGRGLVTMMFGALHHSFSFHEGQTS